VPKIIFFKINNIIHLFLKTAVGILVISNNDSFRVLFDEIASVYFVLNVYLYFSIGNGQLRETSTVPTVSAHFRSL